jgi:hypothetical protein
MKQVNRFFILVSAAALVAACATEAPAPAPESHQIAVASTDSTHPGLKTSGYKKKVVEGQEMYCRNDLVTGSRTEHEGEKCYTADQLQEIQDNSQKFIDSVQGHGSQATSTGTPGAGGPY